MQAWLFASLTLRAARNYVRYSAALRSYSGFVERLFLSKKKPRHAGAFLILLGASS